MARKPETAFRVRFQNRLKLLPNSWFESIQQKAIHGTPDNIGVIRGSFVAIEYKASDKEGPTPLQEHKLGLIAAAGGIALVVNPQNADESFKLLMALATGEIDD